MRFSSSFKVGLLTLVALLIFLFSILWIKGRAFSSADRIEVYFKDVNGMRAGSGVQMMGLRVGQVEEITPVVKGEESFVKLKFVITEPNVTIPKASMISIQQSGLIGEQFLEITPPKLQTVYLPVVGENSGYKNDPVQIMLDDKYYDVGVVKNTRIVHTETLSPANREFVGTRYAYKVEYIVNLPGLILPEFMKGCFVTHNGVKKLRITPLDNEPLVYPQQTSPYTIIEPMRISDFLNLQYQAAESLTLTNKKINELLSQEVINDLQTSIININELTKQATSMMAKAEKLIEASTEDLHTIMNLANKVTTNFVKVTDNIDMVIGDKDFKPTFYETTTNVNKLMKNLNKVLDRTDAQALAEDLSITMKNLNEISTSVNSMTKDEKLKKELQCTIQSVNKAMNDVSAALELVNGLTPDKKREITQIMDDVSVSAKNLKKFTEKLNKRFLLFRLMF